MYSMSSTTKSHACNDHSVLRGSAMLYDQDNCVRLQSLHAININRAVTDVHVSLLVEGNIGDILGHTSSSTGAHETVQTY